MLDRQGCDVSHAHGPFEGCFRALNEEVETLQKSLRSHGGTAFLFQVPRAVGAHANPRPSAPAGPSHHAPNQQQRATNSALASASQVPLCADRNIADATPLADPMVIPRPDISARLTRNLVDVIAQVLFSESATCMTTWYDRLFSRRCAFSVVISRGSRTTARAFRLPRREPRLTGGATETTERLFDLMADASDPD